MKGLLYISSLLLVVLAVRPGISALPSRHASGDGVWNVLRGLTSLWYRKPISGTPTLKSLQPFPIINLITQASYLPRLLDQDKGFLIDIKNAIQQQNTTFNISLILQSWNASDASPCGWYGISCSVVQGQTRVTTVDLSDLGMQGPLVSGFSQLTALSNLDLSCNDFEGKISDDLGNCTNLTTLDLSSTNMSGSVFAEVFSGLTNLQVLKLSENNLTGSVRSVIPKGCGQLESLNLSGNSFSDHALYSWDNCADLRVLDLSNNQLVDSVAGSFGRLKSLQDLRLNNNNLNGNIPASLFPSTCSMQRLDLSVNNLSGRIPSEVGNCSVLEELNLSENQLIGQIPSELGRLGSLRTLQLGLNNLTGGVSSQLTGCTSLSELDLSRNSLEGSVPGFLGQMQSLKYLALQSNQFSGSVTTGLASSSTLEYLDLSNNNLYGSIPQQLVNLSSLQFLLLASNSLTGEIPPELGSLLRLQFLDLSYNQLTGSIPPSLGKLQSLLWLMLAYNNLSGQLPDELGNCSSLLWLNLRSNQLTGVIPDGFAFMGSNPNDTFEYNRKNFHPPKAIGECLMLKRWLPDDYPPFSFVYEIFDGQRCSDFWLSILTGSAISTCAQTPRILGYIHLTENKLSGSIPSKFQGNNTSILLLGFNRFNGSLHSDISLLPLTALNVSHNNLSGHIPESLGDNRCFNLLDFSFNNFSGSIPNSLGKLNQLTRFNVSFNPKLTGAVPEEGQFSTFSFDSYLNDTQLCFEMLPGTRVNASMTSYRYCGSSGNSSQQQTFVSSSRNRPISILLFGIVTGVALLLCGLGSFSLIRGWRLKPAGEKFIPITKNVSERFSREGLDSKFRLFRGATSLLQVKQLTYADILLAANNFDQTNVIGNGGYGVVYKAKLVDGTTVAIKKLVQSGPQGDRGFIAELETLGNHLHDNLVPLLACGTFGSEKLLVYKFLCNGSLEDWLHEKPGGAEILDWSKRLKIACGTAEGLKFLHHGCCPMVIHRDLKASNILLDENFGGHLTDFGLARELDPSDSHVSTVIAGTLGYVPPEYYQSWRATTKGDVYSFGVVLLELITGKKPLNLSSNNDLNLVDWVTQLLRNGQVAEAYDPTVRKTAFARRGTGAETDLLEFLNLAAACTREGPDDRPTMKEVAKLLQGLKQRDLQMGSSSSLDEGDQQLGVSDQQLLQAAMAETV